MTYRQFHKMQLDIIIIILFRQPRLRARQPRLRARITEAPSTRKEPWPSSAGSPFQAAYGPEDRAILPPMAPVHGHA